MSLIPIQGGKGSRRRKLKIKQEQFNNNWDKIFNKKEDTNELDGKSRQHD